MKKKKKDNTGFSLIELIIVVAILAVLVGIIAPQFLKYVEKSKRITDVTNARKVRDAVERIVAIESYDVGTGRYIWRRKNHEDRVPTGEPTNLLSALFKEMGEVPVSVVDKDYFWGVEWYYQETDHGVLIDITEREKIGTVKKVYLCPPSGPGPSAGPQSIDTV